MITWKKKNRKNVTGMCILETLSAIGITLQFFQDKNVRGRVLLTDIIVVT